MEDTAPYVPGSETSQAAAEAIRPHLGAMAAKVYGYLRKAYKHGATDDEVEAALVMRHQTASARRRELVLKGLVVDSGTRRATSSGRTATVWVLREYL